MKRRKEDAADRLANEILAAIRRYKAAKDAPEKPLQQSFIHEDEVLRPVTLEDAQKRMQRMGYCPHTPTCKEPSGDACWMLQKKAWHCPHVERCANKQMCEQAKILGRPEKQAS